MTGCPCTAVCRWSIVASLTALCLWQGLVTASAYLESSDAYAYLTAWRAAAKNAPGEKLALLCNDENRVTPVDRSRLIAISWERAPDPLSLVDGSGDLQSVDCVLSSNWHPVSVGKRLVSNGFMVASTNEYAKTWVRKGVRRFVTCSPVADVSQTREALALVLEAVLIFAPLVFAFGLRGFSWWSLAASFLIAAGLGYVALSHPLLAPNGLGTYGGKAKLLYACGGIPESFLNSAGGMALQPSYPPGLTLLAYLHFLLSGGVRRSVGSACRCICDDGPVPDVIARRVPSIARIADCALLCFAACDQDDFWLLCGAVCRVATGSRVAGGGERTAFRRCARHGHGGAVPFGGRGCGRDFRRMRMCGSRQFPYEADCRCVRRRPDADLDCDLSLARLRRSDGLERHDDA